MTPTVVWINIFGNALTAMSFLVIAITLIMFLYRRDIGHRMLIRLTIIFASVRSIVAIATLWDLSHHFTMATSILRALCALIGFVCVVYFIITNSDVLQTLRTSEMWDRLRKDREADREQARQQMTYLSGETRKRSEAMLNTRHSLR